MRRLALLGGIAVAALALAASGRAARADDQAWEREVRQAAKEQDALLDDARRNHATGSVISRYQSRLDRQPSALAHYLVGRAQFHHGDLPAAERTLTRVLELDPRFWFARLGLALIADRRGDVATARRHVEEAMRLRPDDLDLLKIRAKVQITAKDWDGALDTLRRLSEREPGEVAYRMTRVDLLMQKQDWAGALAELQPLEARLPDDASVRASIALCLVRLSRWDEAARRLELLAREKPTNRGVWDLLRIVYSHKLDERIQRGEVSGAAFETDRANLIRAFERLLPLAEDPEIRKRIEETITTLRHEPLVQAPPAPVEETAEQEWIRVVERCLDERDVERRRMGLQAFHGLLHGESAHPGGSVPVPTAFFTRVHDSIEPDPTCRAWLMRILATAGANAHPFLAMYAAFALYDPSSEVRRTAAEALGAIGTPAGIVYLRAFLDLVPTGAKAEESDVGELNAARLSLVALTKHEDVPGARGAWLTGEEAAASARHWKEFFRGPEGSALLVAAIRDLAEIGEMFPQRHLVDLVNEPGFEVAKAAYVGLLERSKGPPRGGTESALEKEYWPKFPRLALEDVTPTSIQGARNAVNAWWAEWRKARETAKAVGSPDAR